MPKRTEEAFINTCFKMKLTYTLYLYAVNSLYRILELWYERVALRNTAGYSNNNLTCAQKTDSKHHMRDWTKRPSSSYRIQMNILIDAIQTTRICKARDWQKHAYWARVRIIRTFRAAWPIDHRVRRMRSSPFPACKMDRCWHIAWTAPFGCDQAWVLGCA